jgi:hypothetical protein
MPTILLIENHCGENAVNKGKRQKGNCLSYSSL